jgi:hypothetical protein
VRRGYSERTSRGEMDLISERVEVEVKVEVVMRSKSQVRWRKVRVGPVIAISIFIPIPIPIPFPFPGPGTTRIVRYLVDVKIECIFTYSYSQHSRTNSISYTYLPISAVYKFRTLDRALICYGRKQSSVGDCWPEFVSRFVAFSVFFDLFVRACGVVYGSFLMMPRILCWGLYFDLWCCDLYWLVRPSIITISTYLATVDCLRCGFVKSSI